MLRYLRGWAGAVLLLAGMSANGAQVELFSPQGEVKDVRQVAVRFSDPMVPFGDPRLVEPFTIECPEAGTARWADARNWVYDFKRDLPAGVTCTFHLKNDLRTLNGDVLDGTREFRFTTGGPAIRQVMPYEGNRIDEDQVFILGLDAIADLDSIRANAWCEIERMQERVGVRLLEPSERRQILESRRQLFDRMIRALVIRKRDSAVVDALDTRDVLKGSNLERMIANPEGSPVVLLACQRQLPNKARVRLVWGAGIRSLSGVATQKDQALTYQVRDTFQASFSCDRVNAKASCMPILPMTLSFTSPIPYEQASKIRLKGRDGKSYSPVLDEKRKGEAVNYLSFAGPFPEQSAFTLTLPAGLKDDAGRELANGTSFPLTVRTDEYPPLAKFPARFGIVELNADAMLPVTVRNIEAQLDMSLLKVAGSGDSDVIDKLKQSWTELTGLNKEETLEGRMVRMWKDAEPEVIKWFGQAKDEHYPPGATSIFDGSKRQPRKFTLPRATGSKPFEVMGIPLEDPGFYVVELASPRLGAALHGENKPYYVQTAVLVTNLSVHFKRGRENSLVWVTSLDKGEGVTEAEVEVRDCSGKIYARGKTGRDGRLRVEMALPPPPTCHTNYDSKYFVTAHKGNDFSFVFSDWNEGIARWRFNLPSGEYDGPYLASTVFDRSLLRAGETVHMKHFYRRHINSGFESPNMAGVPTKLVISHLGSDQRYEQSLKWDNQGIAESEWQIPQDAKLGTYQVSLDPGVIANQGTAAGYFPTRYSGTFRVEQFRVPTMKAVLKPLATPLVNATSAKIDIQLNYLSGGGAGGAAVKLRGMVQPYSVNFPGYEDFMLANGDVKEGRSRDGASQWYGGGYELDDSEGDYDEGEGSESVPVNGSGQRVLETHQLTLDNAGGARVTLDKLPHADVPQSLQAELEYSDANGEVSTSSTRIPLWPAKIVVGLKADSWVASKEKMKFHVVTLGLDGKPRAGVPVKLDLLQRTSYSHRKRLIGGFYAYESYNEVKRLKDVCEGRSDNRGLLICEFTSPVDGNVIVRASVTDDAGNRMTAHQDAWVAGRDEWWFGNGNDDRMDLLPEKKRYEPGETASLQVRMPFREATALVTVEREGVIDSFVTHLSGKAPVVKVPLKGSYAPNVFVSVLAVRGRVGDVQPTALIDLGKPAFRMGIAELKVGWRAHELKVDVSPTQQAYKVRDKAQVRIKVLDASGKPATGGEVAFAAVDEGLLELMPNNSWKLLDAMMKQRGLEVDTATAQMQVIGRRHYGRKALPPGGGGGRQSSRELFDTLLLWRGRVRLDANGEALVQVPINDSLTSFRLVAVANRGAGEFGTGQASIRSTQDLMLLPGLPPQVREDDHYQAGITIRNASTRPLETTVRGGWRPLASDEGAIITPVTLLPQSVKLAPGEARQLSWNVSAPFDARKLEWSFSAEAEGARDSLKIVQKVIPAVRVRTMQATLQQLDKQLDLPVAIPDDAIPGRGGISLQLSPKLSGDLSAVRDYMKWYPYSCLEQQVSKAIVQRDEKEWQHLMEALPAHLDGDGLAKYFPIMTQGSEVLTVYLVTIADEAGWTIPEPSRQRMVDGLRGFVEGRVVRYSSLPTADLTLRKLGALNALARAEGGVSQSLLSSITIDPNLWPTSAVLDWLDILKRSPQLSNRVALRGEAEQIIRSRLNFQGTIMGFSTERNDALWWLMVSADLNANRALLSLLDSGAWREDLPRMMRGVLSRRHQGVWNTTVANAWGVLATEKFEKAFEAENISGNTSAAIATQRKSLDWNNSATGGELELGWPASPQMLHVEHAGNGKPWLTIQSRAAIPLKEPLSSGYRVTRTVTPVERKQPDLWTRGDLYRVRLDVEAQSDMTWVVVNDPIPSGATILGTGLGRDSQILASGEKRQGWVWPAFEERTFDSFRTYYEFVPKGHFTVEYTVRLNNIGQFVLPETRVEAMYSPEMFSEIPNQMVEVKP